MFLKDVWPSAAEVEAAIKASVQPQMFRDAYSTVNSKNPLWNALQVPEGSQYQWDAASTYIHDPPFFKGMPAAAPEKGAGASTRQGGGRVGPGGGCPL